MMKQSKAQTMQRKRSPKKSRSITFQKPLEAKSFEPLSKKELPNPEMTQEAKPAEQESELTLVQVEVPEVVEKQEEQTEHEQVTDLPQQKPFFATIFDLRQGLSVVQEYQNSQELVEALSKLSGKEFQVFVFQGERCPISKGPMRYIKLPDESVVPLFKTPEPEAFEEDETGILVDDVADELFISQLMSKTYVPSPDDMELYISESAETDLLLEPDSDDELFENPYGDLD